MNQTFPSEGTIIQDPAVAPIPEPTVTLLVSVGLLALAAMTNRRTS
jgi:hypothetical protein